jgi:fermentation-respiration switch protein FrsA (DUF1100 family)
VVALVLFVRWLEPQMAFFPDSGETATPAAYGVPFDAVTVTTSDGERLRAWRMHATAPRARVVYFHGNGANLSNWVPILAGIAKHGYSVFAIDYRGYGLSTGRPTEQGLYRDVDAAIAAAWPQSDSGLPLIYWGRSLGTTMAAHAATVRAPNGVIVEAGFTEGRAIVRDQPMLAFLSHFASYRFPTADLLNRTKMPVLVMHGDRDRIVPFALGRSLFEGVRDPKEFAVIAGGDHNDAVAPDERAYWLAIERFVRLLRP